MPLGEGDAEGSDGPEHAGGAAGAAGPFSFDPDSILYHGHGILVVDKPAGIPVHRGTGHECGLAEEIAGWSSLNPGVLDLRPGRPVLPLHRLDREASGVLILGLARSAARKVQAAFAARAVEKRYLAVIAGPVPDSGRIRGKVRSKLRGDYRRLAAEISYRRLAGDERLSLVEVTPLEGRTHQIRALFAEAGRPLAGDLRYGKPKPARQFLEKFAVPSLLLHALALTIGPEVLGTARRFTAPVPRTFRQVAEKKGWPAALLGG
jgi:23S rRNA-/tRNA-specific pseudouridylate synthase